jgi:hypothetical protein
VYFLREETFFSSCLVHFKMFMLESAGDPIYFVQTSQTISLQNEVDDANLLPYFVL